MSPIWFIIRRTDKNIRNPTFVGLSDLLQTLHSAVGNNTRPFFYNLAFELSPIQRLLNGQILAPRRGANSHCKGLHCWIQRMLARIRHLLACVRRRGCTMSNDRSIHSNKGMVWALGSPPGHHNMNPNDSK